MSTRMRNLLEPLVGMIGHGLKEIAVVRETPEARSPTKSGPPEGNDSEVRTTCPDCGHDQFFEGPHGGMSVNVQCAGCYVFAGALKRLCGGPAQPQSPRSFLDHCASHARASFSDWVAALIAAEDEPASQLSGSRRHSSNACVASCNRSTRHDPQA
jgi:hypothetical protein